MRVRSRCKACKKPIELPADGPAPALCHRAGCRVRYRNRRNSAANEL